MLIDNAWTNFTVLRDRNDLGENDSPLARLCYLSHLLNVPYQLIRLFGSFLGLDSPAPLSRQRLEKALGKDKMKKFGMRALKWPFDKKEVDDAVAVIERCKTTFNLALGCDQAYVELSILLNL